MRAHSTSSWAAWRLHALVGIFAPAQRGWQRFQCGVAARYFQRVTLPLQFWRALGAPSQFRPALPWWQPFVWRWLVVTGWLRPARRPERPV